MTQQLRADAIIATLDVLWRRIDERFPGSSLAKTCGELIDTAKLTARRARAAGRPNLLLDLAVRGLSLVLILVMIFIAVAALNIITPYISQIDLSFGAAGGFLTQLEPLDAAVSLLIALGGAIWYLSTLKDQHRRGFVFRHLHELRSFAHVIDMHQLTKDPVTLSSAATRTASSPERSMTAFELARYLDYCAEMLSLTGKLAALYGEQTDDSEILSAVNEIENLTTGIIRKIWQKIMMLDNDVAMN